MTVFAAAVRGEVSCRTNVSRPHTARCGHSDATRRAEHQVFFAEIRRSGEGTSGKRGPASRIAAGRPSDAPAGRWIGTPHRTSAATPGGTGRPWGRYPYGLPRLAKPRISASPNLRDWLNEMLPLFERSRLDIQRPPRDTFPKQRGRFVRPSDRPSVINVLGNR